MVEESTSIRERLVAPGVASIDIVGDVTAQAENSLMDAYQRATSAGARTFILNLTGLRYMNSSGIGLLVTLLIRVNRQQERLVVHGLSDHYRRIFSLTRLDEAITIFASEAEALAATRAG